MKVHMSRQLSLAIFFLYGMFAIQWVNSMNYHLKYIIFVKLYFSRIWKGNCSFKISWPTTYNLEGLSSSMSPKSILGNIYDSLCRNLQLALAIINSPKSSVPDEIEVRLGNWTPVKFLPSKHSGECDQPVTSWFIPVLPIPTLPTMSHFCLIPDSPNFRFA
jgi:hypothetical protein